MQEVVEMMTEDKKFQRELAAEVRRYNKQKYQRIINQQMGRRNAWFYLDY
jgi:hypothetical protein